jgi:peptide/nickel transport system substrate-binding protein
MQGSYWHRLTTSRIGRRRALGGAIAAGIGAGALSLVGCGGSNKGSSSSASPGGTSAANSLLSQPVDTTSKARPGGVLKHFDTAEVTTFDPIATTSFSAQSRIAAYTYPRMVKFKTAKYPATATGEVEGDLAESFEISGDKLQVTFKLRQGLKWDSRAPTNGRVIDAQDVMATWTRYSRLSTSRGNLVYDASSAPTAPVESMSSPDSKTIVLKLKQPDSSLLPLFGWRSFYVMPREADGGFDPKGEIRGYGPWLLTEAQQGTLRVWTKNPDYYVKGRPYPDKIEVPILPEYATRLAQFKAGNIYTSVAQPDDIIQTKKDVPQANLLQGEAYSTVPSDLGFGYGANGETVWKDKRLRQAVSLLLDRELMIDTLGGRENFKKQGIELPARYHSVIGAGWDGYWMDPQDPKKFGESARFYKYDPSEAKRLLNAAGFPNGLETTLYFNGGTNYGTSYSRAAEVVAGLLTDGGIRAKLGPKEYQNDWLPNYHYAYGLQWRAGKPIIGFDGIAYRAVSGYPTVASQIFQNLHRDGAEFEGATPDGRSPEQGDPEVNGLIEKIKREFDIKKQQELAQDFQRMMAEKAYSVPNLPFSTLTFSLQWPVIGNMSVVRSWPGGAGGVTEGQLEWWIDDSQPPLKKA